MKFIKIYEEFEPILKSDIQIATICKEYGINSYRINPDGTIDVNGDVDLFKKELDKFPVRFGRINGNFYCNLNELTSLEGGPSYVEECFYCNNNKLTSLEGAPKYVGDDFECQGNELTSLLGSPEIVGGDFFCDNNNITSLLGSPEIVGGFYFCSRNTNINSFEGFPKSVGDFTCGSSTISNVWRLFMDATKIELFNEFDIIRGNDLVIDRLNDFLVTIGKEPVDSVIGYNNI